MLLSELASFILSFCCCSGVLFVRKRMLYENILVSKGKVLTVVGEGHHPVWIADDNFFGSVHQQRQSGSGEHPIVVTALLRASAIFQP